MSGIVHSWKSFTSNQCNRLLGRTGSFWQKEPFDRYIRNERHYYQALNYIHYNPVKHDYVESPYDWPWSSVHIYYATYGQQWLRDQWVAYPIDDFGKDWGAWDE